MKKFALGISALIVLGMANVHGAQVQTSVYGKLDDGREVRLFTLANDQGMTARITEYGAILVGVEVPDAKGTKADVTLGFDSLAGWLTNKTYFGATVGRFGNRIAHGKFTLDGKTYTLATNNSPGGIPCHLHGGIRGFDKVLWKGETWERKGERGVTLTYTSADGEEGYPGELKATVTYTLDDHNALTWHAEATTNKPTIVNIVQHTYWNLTGDPKRTILDHELQLLSDQFLPTDAGLIPTGKLATVEGTPMDFRKSTKIGTRIDAPFEALKLGGGYDHCWVLRPGKGVRLAAVLRDATSGRKLEVLTDQPGVQFYSGNFLDGSSVGKGGEAYAFRTGLCLETEGFPDAPNQPSFPSAVLRPGETYRHTLVWRFVK
jgi:aldose 1-epimerase